MLGFLLWGCNKSASQKAVSSEEVDSITLVCNALEDSIDDSWEVMIADDDEKLFHIKRLLEEISYTGEFDRERYDSLLNMHSELVALRYDRKSMSSSDLIDEYDEKTAELIFAVTSFAKEHPKYENYPLMKELVVEIREADDRVLFHRIKYDEFSTRYNELIEQHREILPDDEKPLDPYPVFTLQE